MFKNLITIENLFNAWYKFRKGKTNKPDVILFERNLEDNIFQLYKDINTKEYHHQAYQTFFIWDPKFRKINKSIVRDRIIHHLIYKYLEEIWQPIFIYHSYSCQIGKGTHKAVNNLAKILRRVSGNNKRNIWYLKMDIKKFFASVDHRVLLKLLEKRVYNPEILWLLEEIIKSYSELGQLGKGMPIGNLTSQIFANIYLNELDYFVKQNLQEKYYLRYADDFIFLNQNRDYLENLEKIITDFVLEKLNLEIHPQKIIFGKYFAGIDWLGYIIFPKYKILRTKTKRRMFKKINKKIDDFNSGLIEKTKLYQTIQSYFGLLKHCNSYNLKTKLKNDIWLKTKN